MIAPNIGFLKWGVPITVAFGVGAAGLLQFYVTVSSQAVTAPARVPAELDAKGRRDAIEDRKQELSVHGQPYPATSADRLTPISDNEHQRRIKASFLDEASGLFITAETHLCLPGIDPCISGGQVAVTDGVSEWSISFQLLGSENPSPFHSHIPKSQDLLERLEWLALETDLPMQLDYYTTLEGAIAADADSFEQHQHVRKLVQLLLASYFAADEYDDTFGFAKEHQLIN